MIPVRLCVLRSTQINGFCQKTFFCLTFFFESKQVRCTIWKIVLFWDVGGRNVFIVKQGGALTSENFELKLCVLFGFCCSPIGCFTSTSGPLDLLFLRFLYVDAGIEYVIYPPWFLTMLNASWLYDITSDTQKGFFSKNFSPANNKLIKSSFSQKKNSRKSSRIVCVAVLGHLVWRKYLIGIRVY